MKSFKEWVKVREMAGGGMIVGNPSCDKVCNNPDYQVAGAFCNGKKKKSKSVNASQYR